MNLPSREATTTSSRTNSSQFPNPSPNPSSGRHPLPKMLQGMSLLTRALHPDLAMQALHQDQEVEAVLATEVGGKEAGKGCQDAEMGEVKDEDKVMKAEVEEVKKGAVEEVKEVEEPRQEV
jgi:hypothetical protein